MAVVLVVEDDRAVSGALCRHLERREHRTLLADTAAQALLVGKSQRPDAAIFDLRLPDGDGLAVFTELKRQWPTLVGVMLTGFGSVNSAVASLQAGMADYLEKPIDLAHLVARIEALVAASPARPAPTSGGPLPTLRLARLIALALDSPEPPRTLAEWGRAVGVARGTLRTWCHLIRVHPHEVLYLMRGLWALENAARLGVLPNELLGYLDSRSVREFAARGGLRSDDWQTMTLVQFCLEQQFCRNNSLIAELVRILSDRARRAR